MKQKAKVATVSLAGCFGCHMSFMDVDLELLDLIDLIEFRRSPLTDIKTFNLDCDIGFIEGGVCNEENVEVLHDFRRHCKTLVSVGECAIMGGLPALRNDLKIGDCLEEAYSNVLSNDNPNHVIPRHEDLPRLLNKIYPCHELVKIEHFMPGCPPPARAFTDLIKSVVEGTKNSTPYGTLRYD